ncbi:MAG: DUF4136 domain-containing protein [Rhodoferax sp.]|nr:DUF4136 domain-containing protein [Rhodoferax sp.]
MSTRNPFSRPLVTAILALSALLTGCASVSTLESDVLSFASAPVSTQAGPFTFERLPSQYQDPKQTLAFEQMAQAALEKRGFTRNDASPQFSVQVSAATSDAVLVYPDPFFGRFSAAPFGRSRRWHGRVFYGPLWPDSTVHVSRVRLEIRDLRAGTVVYESTATNERSWFDGEKMFPAMFEAALADFPAPPNGVRKVIVKLPGN